MNIQTPLILIGGFGFVGRNIIDVVANKSCFSMLSPVVVDDLSNAAPGYKETGVPFHAGDYNDEAAVSFINGVGGDAPRVFVFLAGETRVAESRERPLDFVDANIAKPARFVMETVRKGDKFILVSTAGALFDGTFEIAVDSPYCPKNFYGSTKAAEEMILEKLVDLRAGDFSITRLTNVFGKFSSRKKSAIHAFTRAVIAGRKVTLNGDGQQTRDFIYAGDVGTGIARLATRMCAGEEVCRVHTLGAGKTTALFEVVSAIEAAAGKPLEVERAPATELLATEPRRVTVLPSDVRVLLDDEITGFKDGIRATHDWYRQNPA